MPEETLRTARTTYLVLIGVCLTLITHVLSREPNQYQIAHDALSTMVNRYSFLERSDSVGELIANANEWLMGDYYSLRPEPWLDYLLADRHRVELIIEEASWGGSNVDGVEVILAREFHKWDLVGAWGALCSCVAMLETDVLRPANVRFCRTVLPRRFAEVNLEKNMVTEAMQVIEAALKCISVHRPYTRIIDCVGLEWDHMNRLRGEVAPVYSEIERQPPDVALSYLSVLSQRDVQRVSFFGIQVKSAHVAMAGPLAIAVVLGCLWSHLRHALELENKNHLLVTYPWMVLFHGRCFAVAAYASVVVLPLAAASSVKPEDGGGGSSEYVYYVLFALVSLASFACVDKMIRLRGMAKAARASAHDQQNQNR